MNFTKVQGAGNDFVLIEPPDNIEYDWSSIAKQMCDRHFGIGADGLLLLLTSQKANFRMRIFNQDGTEADACGNGLRSLVKYIFVRKLSSDATVDHLRIETMAGIRNVLLSPDSIKVYMGTPIFSPDRIPVVISNVAQPILDHPVVIDGRVMKLDILSMGNPHAVYFTDQPVADFPLSLIGPKIETHSIFPKHTNFEIARIISREKIESRVWERGVGETLACGSGACAVGVVHQIRNGGTGEVDIILPGGILSVSWDGHGEVLLGGPAKIVFSGTWSDL